VSRRCRLSDFQHFIVLAKIIAVEVASFILFVWLLLRLVRRDLHWPL
jgi:hypothetical protein